MRRQTHVSEKELQSAFLCAQQRITAFQTRTEYKATEQRWDTCAECHETRGGRHRLRKDTRLHVRPKTVCFGSRACHSFDGGYEVFQDEPS